MGYHLSFSPCCKRFCLVKRLIPSHSLKTQDPCHLCWLSQSFANNSHNQKPSASLNQSSDIQPPIFSVFVTTLRLPGHGDSRSHNQQELPLEEYDSQKVQQFCQSVDRQPYSLLSPLLTVTPSSCFQPLESKPCWGEEGQFLSPTGDDNTWEGPLCPI